MIIDAIDRVQLVVKDRAAVADAWRTLLDAEPVREDRVPQLAARRTVLAAGTSEVELLEPDGAGPVADAPVGLFAAGFAARDLEAARSHLEARGIAVADGGDQLFIAPEALDHQGLRVVVSRAATRPRQGLLERIYEVTNLVSEPKAWSARFAEIFGLDPTSFVPIESERFGYTGTLTLFHPDALDRVEIIHPYDRAKTMGRFHERRGACLYMCYGESDRANEIRERATLHCPDQWTGPPTGDVDNLFLHPNALGGVMLGVSRSTFAWTWSGSPERVR